MTTNQQINSFETKDELNSEYLYYFFRKIKNFFYKKASQTTLPILNKSQCKQIKIPLPPLEKQKSIVAHLDQVFAVNAELKGVYEEKIAHLRELKQSLLREAFEGRLVSDEDIGSA